MRVVSHKKQIVVVSVLLSAVLASVFYVLIFGGGNSGSGTDISDASIPSIPPGKCFKWSIASKNSHIDQRFILKKKTRGYYFDVGFGSPVAWDDVEHQEWRTDKRVQGFLFNEKLGGELKIPVHIKIERLVEGRRTLITDRLVRTVSTHSGGYVIKFKIVMIILDPGKYRVVATAMQDTSLPDGLGSYLCVSYPVKP